MCLSDTDDLCRRAGEFVNVGYVRGNQHDKNDCVWQLQAAIVSACVTLRSHSPQLQLSVEGRLSLPVFTGDV